MIDYDTLEAFAQPGWFSKYDMQVLVPEVMALMSNDIYLEIGVHKGRSLSVVAATKQAEIKIIGVDCLRQPELQIYLDDHASPLLHHWWAESLFASVVFPYLTHGAKIQVLLIDGDHSYAGCVRDITAWHPHMAPEGVMLFHDYDITSPGVVQAVDEFAMRINRPVGLLQAKSSLAKIQLC